MTKTVRIALEVVMGRKVLLLQVTMMLDQTVRNCIGNSLVVVVLHAVAYVLEKTFTPNKLEKGLTCVDDWLLTQAY